jgi:hypothetical protein
MLTNITEYAEEMPVFIGYHSNYKRIVIDAANEGGHNGTDVDLLQVIQFLLSEGILSVYDPTKSDDENTSLILEILNKRMCQK